MDLINLTQILKLIAALTFVVALMGGLAFALKRLGFVQAAVQSNGKKRLKVVESLSLDPRRRAVILACDDAQHLVILGSNGETIVKTDLSPVDRENDAPVST